MKGPGPQRDRVAFNTAKGIEVLDKLARATTDGALPWSPLAGRAKAAVLNQ